MRFIIRGKDVTESINNYYFDNQKPFVFIMYNGNNKQYSYQYKDIEILPHSFKEIESHQILIYRTHNKVEVLRDIYRYEEIGDGENSTIKINKQGKVIYYKNHNIAIESFKNYIVKNDEIIVFDGEVKNIETIEFSDSLVRVKFPNNEEKYIMNKNRIKIIKNIKAHHKDLFDYYKYIASIKDLGSEEYVEHYLENQLNEIVIQKDELLDIYLSKKYDNLKLRNDLAVIYPFGINLSQRKAIINALENRISLIQGPPGTGKTQSILNIIANLIIRNKSVAVVSSNNEAVKNVLEKMRSKNYDFLVALLGKKENKESFFNNQVDYPDEILSWSINHEQMEDLLFKIKEHENNVLILLEYTNEHAKLKQELYEYEHEYKFFSEYLQDKEVNKLKRFHFFKLNSEKLLNILVGLNFPLTNIESIIQKIKFFIQYGIYDFKQYNDIAPIILSIQNQYYKEKIVEINTRLSEIQEMLKDRSYDDELKELQENSEKYFKSFLANKYKILSRQKFSLDNYFYKENFKDFIFEYPIILSTTHAISHSKNRDFKFDYLIIDEASQVELIPGIIALSTAKNVIVVGDKKQLSHIPEEKIKKSEYKKLSEQYNVSYEYDYYENSLLDSFDYIFKDDIKVLLREHYRCDRRIIEFCNRKYYEGKLICLSKHEQHNPLVLLKTTPGNHLRYGKKTINKITNIREIESLVDKEFIQKIGINLNEDKTFGFIAPFRGQANEASKILPSEFQKDTVHKFQGRECDIIMFSSVLDKKVRSKILMKFVDEPHLLNVAISRAEEQFILVSHVDTFLEENGDISDLIKYMQYYEEDCLTYQSQVKSIFDLLYSDYSSVLKQREKDIKWKKSRFNSENLLYELLDDLLDESKYKYVREVRLKEMFQDKSLFTKDEVTYIQNNSRVDVVIYNIFDKKPLLGIEVDGFASHDNNPDQLKKDRLKDSIFEKGKIPLLRLKTNESNEREKIEKYLYNA